jgi:glycosyltransferase involved in cell wall biosynthesis
VVLLPAATDPIDGLNKELNQWCITYYRSVFNRVCLDMGANEVDWYRPYIIQVARFDPSKGIPDVLEAYRLLRLKMDGHFEHFDIPQLVICGHGSIDDPDGTVIYEQVCEILEKPEYVSISSDVIAVRLPASDQVLNMILRGAHVALQLSHREGSYKEKRFFFFFFFFLPDFSLFFS